MNMTKINEHDQKIENDEHIFVKIQMLMFIIVVIFILFSIFGQTHPFFGHVQRLMFDNVKFRSSSNVKVHRCQFFSVKF